MISCKFLSPTMRIVSISAECAKFHHVAMSRQPLPRLSEWSRSEIRCTLPHWNFTFTCQTNLNWLVSNAWEIQLMYRASNKRYSIFSLEFLYLQSKNCSIQRLGLTSRCLISYLLWSFCMAGFNDVQSFREVWYATRYGNHHWNHFQIPLPWGVFWGFGVRSIIHFCNEFMVNCDRFVPTLAGLSTHKNAAARPGGDLAFPLG